MRVTVMAPTEQQRKSIEQGGNTVFARLPALEGRNAVAFFVKEWTVEIAIALFQASFGMQSEIKIGDEIYKFDDCGVDIEEIVIIPLVFVSIAFRDIGSPEKEWPAPSATDGSCPRVADPFDEYMAKSSPRKTGVA